MEIKSNDITRTNDIIRAMFRKETYDEEVSKIELVQTHISWVFLTGKYAYKIKKPVNFGFLDFSTLEKRRYYCYEEFRINKLLADEMYIEVVTINKKGDRIKIKGEGAVVEYAIKMKELPRDRIMNVLLKKNMVKISDIEEISRIVSDFHKKTKCNKETLEIGYKGIRRNWYENFEQTRRYVNRVIREEEYDYIKRKIIEFIKDNDEIFRKRIKERKYKECHGDLHSENIFIVDEKNRRKIYIFDAIEFNKYFSYLDIINDIAFFVMDLEYHKKEDFANKFIKSYLRYNPDDDMEKLLNFYKCYRAYVRFKVNCFKLDDKYLSENEKIEAKDTASRYFKLSYEYAKLI